MIKRNEYAMFLTKESEGEDVCIVDSCNRKFYINKDDWDQFVEDVVFYQPFAPKQYSTNTTFDQLEAEEMLDDVIQYYESRGNFY